jgi:hypothetical protein
MSRSQVPGRSHSQRCRSLGPVRWYERPVSALAARDEMG